MLGRMPALPKRALRVSIPLTRKLLFDSRPPAIDRVVSPRPVHDVAGRDADPDRRGARRKLCELDEIAAVEGQLDHHLAVHHLPDRGALRVQQRGGRRRDRHVFGHRRDNQFHVDPGPLPDLNPDVLDVRALEPRGGDLELVDAGFQLPEQVRALRVGDGALHHAGLDLRQRHGGARHAEIAGIDHAYDKVAGDALGTRRGCRRDDRQHHQDDDGAQPASSAVGQSTGMNQHRSTPLVVTARFR